ncbi:MAG: DUF4403 family protein [Chitinophagales bacterium]
MSNFFKLWFIFISAVFFISCSKKIIPDKPSLVKTDFRMDSLPESEINIPIQLNLKPVYNMAEKTVDTVFTSLNWPGGWVQEGCDTRYKYIFRRSPLQMKASGTILSIGFTGYYKIIGSTRVCLNGTALSPWTPACRCGYDEGERRVNVSFQNSVLITPDLKARLLIKRLEPEPVDKCTVCFWGQDVTADVMKGLKEQLDKARSDMEKSFGSYDLRPKFQGIWDQLNRVYNLYGLGWLQINPTKIRINNLFARNDSLNVYLGLAAKPLISFERPQEHLTIAPNITDFSYHTGFNIFLDAILNYDSLTNILSGQLRNKRFDLTSNKYIIIKDCSLYGMDNENLIVKVNFEGSEQGLFYLIGKPSYDATTKIIELKDLDFDIRSKNMLLKTAEWLFNKRIINELRKYTRFDLSSYITSAITVINQQLNKEWIKGIRSNGKMEDIKIVNIYPLREHLVVRSNCSGNLLVKIDAANFNL